MDEDHLALRAACQPGTALCTIIGIEGGFSRRLGAQLAVLPDGSVIGNLADGCLERQLASDVRSVQSPEIRRYGKGSSLIDFRLPCGGGLDILLDPSPDQDACQKVLDTLRHRQAAELQLPANGSMAARQYIPGLQMRVFGEGPEVDALARIGGAAGRMVQLVPKNRLSLGQESCLAPADAFTAILLLFHDHEWEHALLHEALRGESFYIGAQGGETARAARLRRLVECGATPEDLTRIRSPVGLLPRCRSPSDLALSILAEVVGEYEGLRANLRSTT